MVIRWMVDAAARWCLRQQKQLLLDKRAVRKYFSDRNRWFRDQRRRLERHLTVGAGFGKLGSSEFRKC